MTLPTMMLAARAHRDEKVLRLEQVPIPEPRAGEVLVRVRAAGVTRGFLAMWQNGRLPILPMTVGQESAGEIAVVGPGVTGWAEGDRVRVHATLSCGSCRHCRNGHEQACAASSAIGMMPFGREAMALYSRFHNGGLAEYVLAPASNLDRLPELVSFDEGARVHYAGVSMTALAATEPEPGDIVVVTGGSGASGAAVIAVAPFFGIRKVIAVARSADGLRHVADLAPGLVDTIALEELPESWAESGGLSERIRELTGGEGADRMIDFLPAPSPATLQAIESMRKRGVAVLSATGRPEPRIPYGTFQRNLYTVKGNQGALRNQCVQLLSLLGAGRVSLAPLISSRFPLTELAVALDAMEARDNLFVNVNP